MLLRSSASFWFLVFNIMTAVSAITLLFITLCVYHPRIHTAQSQWDYGVPNQGMLSG